MATAEIRQHVSTAGSLAPSCGSAAQRLRFANPFFRDLLMTLDRRCRYSLSLVLCAGKCCARTPILPFLPPYHAAGGVAQSVPDAVSTPRYNRALFFIR